MMDEWTSDERSEKGTVTRSSQFVTSDGRTAPSLWVKYLCPKCGEEAVLDAYDGPPSCLGKPGTDEAHSATFCRALEIVNQGGQGG